MLNKLKAYKAYSNDVLFFKFIINESDLESTADLCRNQRINEEEEDHDSKNSPMSSFNDQFRAEFTHQIFGEEETIFGYKNLKINYYLTPGLLDAYIGLSYTDKIKPQRFEGVEADDVYAQFIEFGCSPGFTRNLDTFCSEKIAQDRAFRPFGQKIHEYQKSLSKQNKFKDITNGNGDSTMSTFEIYKIDSSMPDFELQKFRDYIVRVQTMLVFFIETSNFIDEEDPKWAHYILYEKRKTSSGEIRYLTAGYLSAYHFYAYPDKTRTRVSQMLIMPPYQRFGHGAELLEAVYRDAAADPDVVDVTAEAPSSEFIALRDFVTTKLCSTLASFRDVSKLRQGFSSNMVAEALKSFKIPRLQSRRAYEIIRMANTNENDDTLWGEFCAVLKKKFYSMFLKFSKFARQSKMVNNETEEQAAPSAEQKPSSDSKNFNFRKAPINKMSSLNARFGGGDNCNDRPFSSSNANPFSANAAAGSSTVLKSSFDKETVSFGNVLPNTSYSSSNGGDESSYDEHNNSQQAGSGQIDFNKLLVSEPDRSQYINQQLEDTLKEYRKVIQRLEACRILPF